MDATADRAGPTRGGFTAACVAFCGRLRAVGLPVPTAAAADLLRAADLLGMHERRSFRLAARALLVDDRRQWALFDAVFDEFWRTTGSDRDSGEFIARASGGRHPEAADALPSTRAKQAAGTESDDPRGTGFGATARDSGTEVARDLAVATSASWHSGDVGGAAALSTRQLLAVHELLPLAQQCHPVRRLPRPHVGSAARYMNRRATLRQTARHGRVMGPPVIDDVQVEQRPVIVLADASRSMHAFTHTVLGVSALLTAASTRTEAFMFATTLTRVTDCLRRPPRTAVAAVERRVPDWGTGTRIGPVIGEFNRRWSHRLRTSTGVVVLITDGLDAGDPDLLATEATVLRQRSWRLVWVNPLAGGAGFAPSARGMRALLPHVDVLLPCRDAAGVRRVLHLLRGFRGARDADPIVMAYRRRWAPMPPRSVPEV